jgi:hypothetical protein
VLDGPFRYVQDFRRLIDGQASIRQQMPEALPTQNPLITGVP